MMREIHEGVCDNHSGKRRLEQKALRQGFYWPTMQNDSADFVRKCDKCQTYTHVPSQPLEPLSPVISLWLFAKWGIDLIGSLPIGRA